jgi:hypothetical protein
MGQHNGLTKPTKTKKAERFGPAFFVVQVFLLCQIGRSNG